MVLKSHLKSLGISFKTIHHPPVMTCIEAEVIDRDLSSKALKNLFLKSKRKSDKYYLVILKAKDKLNIKYLESVINDRISFASDTDLENILKISTGAVSPFALMDDKEKKVMLLIQKDVLEQDFVSFHPNINTETIELKTIDFKNFLCSTNLYYKVF